MDTAAEMPNPRGRVLGTGVSLNMNRRGLVGAYLDAASAAITEFGGSRQEVRDGPTALLDYPVARNG